YPGSGRLLACPAERARAVPPALSARDGLDGAAPLLPRAVPHAGAARPAGLAGLIGAAVRRTRLSRGRGGRRPRARIGPARAGGRPPPHRDVSGAAAPARADAGDRPATQRRGAKVGGRGARRPDYL